MKKIKFQAVAVMAFLAMGAASCSDDDSKPTRTTTRTAYVTEVAGPESGDVNQELSYNVKYTVDNACGTFKNFTETASGTTKTIEVIAQYTGSVCADAAVVKDTIYKFKPTTAGTYSLKFKKSATEFVTKAVIVD